MTGWAVVAAALAIVGCGGCETSPPAGGSLVSAM
jgi:hypothetical protein